MGTNDKSVCGCQPHTETLASSSEQALELARYWLNSLAHEASTCAARLEKAQTVFRAADATKTAGIYHTVDAAFVLLCRAISASKNSSAPLLPPWVILMVHFRY